MFHILLISSTSHRQSGSLEAKSVIRAAATGSLEAAGQISPKIIQQSRTTSTGRTTRPQQRHGQNPSSFDGRTAICVLPFLLHLVLRVSSTRSHHQRKRNEDTQKKNSFSRILPAAAKRTHTTGAAAPMNKIRTRNTINRAHNRDRSRQG